MAVSAQKSDAPPADGGNRSAAIAVIVVASALLLAGVFVLWWSVFRSSEKDGAPPNPLRPYALQILGLAFVLPALLVLSVTARLDGATLSALLGTMIAFVFGSGRNAKPDSNDAPPRHGPPSVDPVQPAPVSGTPAAPPEGASTGSDSDAESSAVRDKLGKIAAERRSTVTKDLRGLR